MAMLHRLFGYLIATILLYVFIQMLFVLGLAWALAFAGDTEMLSDLMDQDRPIGDLSLWKFGVGIAFSVLFLGAIGMLVWNLNRLRLSAARYELASPISAKALRCTGQGLIAIWVAMLLLDYILPMVIFGSRAAEPEWALEVISIDILFAFVGAVLISVAGVAKEASDLRDENEQFI